MSFLAPWFLLGILAAAIPVIIHLRRSRRNRMLVFSTTMFFDEQFIRTARSAKLHDRLLMLLRMLLLALFAIALAQPLVKIPGISSLMIAGGKRHVAIVIDDSSSMALVTQQGMLLQRAKQGALKVVDQLSSVRGDRATVILAGRRDRGVRVLFDQPTNDLQAVREAIDAITMTDLATDLDAALAAAAGQLGARLQPADSSDQTQAMLADDSGKPGTREIYLFSDMQSSALATRTDLLPAPGLGLFFVAVQPPLAASTSNLSIDALQYGTARPLVGVPFTFRALLTNAGSQSQNADLQLVIDEKVVARKSVHLPAGRSQVVRLVHRFTDAGWFGGHAELTAGQVGADALQSDSRRYFALRVEQSARVLAVNGSPSQLPVEDELFFMQLALSIEPEAATTLPLATGQIDLQQVSANELPTRKLDDYSLLVLANVPNLPPALLEAIERYVDQGGNLLITLGDRVDVEAYNSWVSPARLHGGLLPGPLRTLVGQPLADRSEQELLDAGYISWSDPSHPAMSGFGEGQLGSLASVRLFARYQVDAPEASVLMRESGGAPLLLERRFGGGRVMLFTSSIDRDWNNFPLQPTYVPWLYRVVGYLAQPGLDRANFVRTGQLVELPTSATRLRSLQYIRPDGQTLYPEPGEADPGRPAPMLLTEIEKQGVYQVRAGNARSTDAPLLLLAANAPSEEHQLEYLGKQQIAAAVGEQTPWLWIADPESIGSAENIAQGGYGLWDQLLMLALLAALVEPWIANLISRRRLAGSQPSARSQDASDSSPPGQASGAAPPVEVAQG